ncbi:PhoD-like phosphatase N-terminal domain-containing protein [Plantactinospora sp. DSM 117369]
MTALDRRTLLRAGLTTGAGLASGALLGGAAATAAPDLAARSGAPGWRPGGRPVLTHGVQSGDATAHSAVVWTRADRAGRLHLEVGRRPDLRGARRVRGAFGPNTLDGTFGPRAVFVHAPPRANTSPAEGFQHFGEAAIDGPTGALTVHLRDQDGRALWTTTLPAPR